MTAGAMAHLLCARRAGGRRERPAVGMLLATTPIFLASRRIRDGSRPPFESYTRVSRAAPDRPAESRGVDELQLVSLGVAEPRLARTTPADASTRRDGCVDPLLEPVWRNVEDHPDSVSLTPPGDVVGIDPLEDEDRAEPSRVEDVRSEEHTSELQSRPHLVCRLLLEKKKE